MGRSIPAKPKIIVPKYAPDRLQGLLELIFPDHRLRQKIARAFLEKVREQGKEGLPETAWIDIVIDLLQVPELKVFLEEVQGQVSRTRLQKEIAKKAELLGLVDEEGHNLFYVYKGQYAIVVKILRRLGLVYKKEGAYHTSPHFAKVLEQIARVWLDWRAGLVD